MTSDEFFIQNKNTFDLIFIDGLHIYEQVIKDIDCRVICGYRGKDEQEKLFLTKKTELRYPSSKHNSSPSRAVYLIPNFNNILK